MGSRPAKLSGYTFSEERRLIGCYGIGTMVRKAVLRAGGWRWLACIAFRPAACLDLWLTSILRGLGQHFAVSAMLHTRLALLAAVDLRDSINRGSAASLNWRKTGEFRIQGTRCGPSQLAPARDVRMPSFTGSTRPTLSLLAMYLGNPDWRRFSWFSRDTTWTCSRQAERVVQPLLVQQPCVSPIPAYSPGCQPGYCRRNGKWTPNSYCRRQAVFFPRNLAKQIDQIFTTKPRKYFASL